MALSLIQRKDIRDSGKKAQEALDRLHEATGMRFEFIVDFAGLLAKFTDSAKSGYGDRIGTVFNECEFAPRGYFLNLFTYLEAIVDGLIRFCKDPLCKESVDEMCSKKQITVDIVADKEYEKDKKSGSYCRMRLNSDGMLVAQIKQCNICSNVSDIAGDLNTTFAGDTSLALAARRNIAEYAEKRDEALATMTQALGKTCVFEVDWPTLTKSLDEKGYTDRHGEVMLWYLEGLAYYVKKVCDDELGKEAMQDKFSGSEAVIRFVIDDKVSSYNSTKFENDALYVKVPTKNLCSNVSDTGSDIEKQL